MATSFSHSAFAQFPDSNTSPFNNTNSSIYGDGFLSMETKVQLGVMNTMVNTFGLSGAESILETGAGPFGDIMGSMYHKDAHDGPGGLYGIGGQFEESFVLFEMMVGGNGMAFWAQGAFAGLAPSSSSTTPMMTHDEMCSLVHVALVAVSTGVGGFMGAVAGGTAGSAVPGAGTVAGGVVGGSIGAGVGTIGGELGWILINQDIGCET